MPASIVSEATLVEVKRQLAELLPHLVCSEENPNDYSFDAELAPKWTVHIWAPSARYEAWRVNYIGPPVDDFHHELAIKSEDPNVIMKAITEHIHAFCIQHDLKMWTLV